MKQSFKKINKEFRITDSSVNPGHYRCLTSGFQLNEILKNPIGFFNNGTGEFPRDLGVLVRWTDFRIESDTVYAKPIINVSHPRGLRTINEIESGFLNAASVGKIVVLEASTDKNLMLPGQTKPTLTKWFPREISIVDIIGSPDSFANLIDADNKNYNLDDITGLNFLNTIDKDKVLKALKLKSGDENLILSTIYNLVESSDKIRQLENELKNLKDFNQYEGKSFDELYASDKLELVRKKYPQLYEKIKKEKFPNLK